MLLSIDVDNASSESIRTIQIRVVEEWNYEAYFHSLFGSTEYYRCFTRDLLSFDQAVILEPRNRDHYERRIRLPALQPSYACKITVHSYYVQVLITTSIMSRLS